ncbi:MAG: DUF2384 domain-containing protein [Hyphomicrobiales bacterium]|nr:DUF2384 domain-containing protein [Hyphomicrobiales bacterium]
MDSFLVGEQRTLEFHIVVLDLVLEHPNLIDRARQALARMAPRHPNPDGVIDRWRDLLDGPASALAPALLTDDPAGGLLRANSPFNGLFSTAERNAVWQRVGLRQFARLFLQAGDDLDLSPVELAAIVGVAVDELGRWRRNPPQTMAQSTLERLKQVLSVQRSLAALLPDRPDRHAWLRGENNILGARPVDLLLHGGADQVRDHLAVHAVNQADPRDLPVF